MNKSRNITESIITANTTFMECHINGTSGSALPGIKAKVLCPDILEITSSGVRTILITGTNGKTTTTKMMATMLSDAGIECFYNKEGANIDSRITTSFVLNADIDGNPVIRTAVIECDELYVPMMMRILRPEVLVILPLSEDQIDRLICKPVDMTGSTGVIKISSFCEWESGIYYSLSHYNSKEVVLEEFVNGKEYSAECIAYNGEYSLLTVTETITTEPPYFVEIGHRQPAALRSEMIDKIE